MANENKTMKKMTEAEFDKAIIRKPQYRNAMGGLYDEGEKSFELTPCILLIYKIIYEEDNHDGENLAYTTINLWDKARLKTIGSISSGYYPVNELGIISNYNKVILDQEMMTKKLIKRYHKTILKVTKYYLKKEKSPLLDYVEDF